MVLTLFIGFIVMTFSVALVVIVFLLIKKLFGLKSRKEISIYVDERKETISPTKITNTPFKVDRKGKIEFKVI